MRQLSEAVWKYTVYRCKKQIESFSFVILTIPENGWSKIQLSCLDVIMTKRRGKMNIFTVILSLRAVLFLWLCAPVRSISTFSLYIYIDCQNALKLSDIMSKYHHLSFYKKKKYWLGVTEFTSWQCYLRNGFLHLTRCAGTGIILWLEACAPYKTSLVQYLFAAVATEVVCAAAIWWAAWSVLPWVLYWPQLQKTERKNWFGSVWTGKIMFDVKEILEYLVCVT